MTCALRVLVFALLQSSAPVYASTPGDCKTGACASQIDDATAMIQSKAKVSLALQTSEDDPMLLMKSSGAERLAASQKMESSMENAVTKTLNGNYVVPAPDDPMLLMKSSGVEQLAASQRMESSMENAVIKMLNGNYVIPAPEYWELIEEQLKLMMENLFAEKGGFQMQIDGANANVAQCNTNMNNASDGSVAAAKASADALNSTHHACRVAEKAAYDNKISSCAAMDKETEDVSKAAPQCNCLLSNSSDTSVVQDCLAKNRNWVQSFESVLQTKKEDCDTKTDAWSSQADVCDQNQSSYEVAVCTYAMKLENMRSTHETCYSDAISARTSTKELVEVEEKHLKAVLASVKKILCFMSILKKANTTNVDMHDFETCKNMNVTVDTTYLNNSVPDMDITYSPADPKSTDTHQWDLSVMPGDGQWAADAYSEYNTEWLRETVVCPHMTTTTTTQASYGQGAAIAAGFEHSLILKANGSVYAVGRNHYGQLGDGTKTDRTEFVHVADNVIAVSGGFWHSMILMSDGSVKAAGQGIHCQLGTGDKIDRESFVQVVPNEVTAIAAGGLLSMVLKTDGSVYAAGQNNYGQVGDGTKTERTEFVHVADDVRAISTHQHNALILKTDGSVHAAGYNARGQLGDGSRSDRSTFKQLFANGVAAMASGVSHIIILTTNGIVHASGDSRYGQFGDGTNTEKTSFVEVASNCSAIAAAGQYSMIVKTDGSVHASGRNWGQLGDGTYSQRQTFVPLDVDEVSAIDGSTFYVLIKKTDGSLYATGKNTYGQLGDGTKTTRNKFAATGVTGMAADVQA